MNIKTVRTIAVITATLALTTACKPSPQQVEVDSKIDALRTDAQIEEIALCTATTTDEAVAAAKRYVELQKEIKRVSSEWDAKRDHGLSDHHVDSRTEDVRDVVTRCRKEAQPEVSGEHGATAAELVVLRALGLL